MSTVRTGWSAAEYVSARVPVLGPWLLMAAAMLLWWIGLRGTDPGRMDDWGLVSVLPPAFYASLVLLAVSMAVLLHERPLRLPALFLNVAALILILHGTPAILYGTVRYTWAYKHLAVVDYIQRHGAVNPTIPILSVYHEWPGFFALSALLVDVAGLGDAEGLAIWAPVVFQLLNLGGLVLVLRALTRDPRVVWLAAWLFVLGNWVGQDYFAPQALSFAAYLMIVGILLTWFSRREPPARQPDPAAVEGRGLRRRLAIARQMLQRRVAMAESWETPSRPIARAGLIAIAVLLVAAIVSSHQLTPFMMIPTLAGLVVVGRLRLRSFPILVAVMAVAWAVTMGALFLGNNLFWIVRSIGQLTKNVNENLIDLSKAGYAQVVIALFGRGLTALILALAGLGAWRRVRRGYWDLAAAVLVAGPLFMLAGNAYGGEMLFRVYLFMLPGLVFFAAAALLPSPADGRSWRTVALVMAASAVLLAGFTFAYFGKERVNYITPDELAAVDYVSAHAPPGALLFDASWGWTLQHRHYELYEYRSLVGLRANQKASLLADAPNFLARMMSDQPYPAVFLTITKSQKAYFDMMGLLPPGALAQVEQILVASPRFEVVFANRDATVFRLLEAPSAGGVP